MAKMTVSTAEAEPKTLLLSAYYSVECELDEENFAEEFLSLVKTEKIPCEKVSQVKMRRLAPSHFF